MEQAWVVQQFRDRTGGEFLTEIARIVLVAQGQALSRVSQAVQIGEYSRPVAKDMFPYERRSRSLAGKPLAGFCATQSRRIPV